MKVLDSIAIERSEIRTAIAEILDCDTLTDEQDEELARLTAKAKKLEVRHRAALTAEPEDEVAAVAPPPVDAEERERRELRRRSSVVKYLAAGLEGHRLTGPEEEFRAAVGAEERSIPLDLFEEDEVETREDAVSPPPSAGSSPGFRWAPIVPKIFQKSLAPRLGVAVQRTTPGTYSMPVLTTGMAAEAKAKGEAAESSAAAWTVRSTTPHRISARMSLDEQDLRSTNLAAWESALRSNLSMTLSSVLDNAMLTGTGSGATISGLLHQLASVDAPTAVETFASWGSKISGFVDGLWARGLGDLRVCLNPQVFGLLSSLYASSDDSVSAREWTQRQGTSLFCSSRMPASVSSVGDGVVLRAGSEVMPMSATSSPAVMPTWSNLQISDPYTDSAKAVRHFTASIFVGDVLIRQSGAYRRIRVKTA